ncbi:MAG: aspartate/glutamate racemase family protein, partial [Acetobacteraceae bacterium]
MTIRIALIHAVTVAIEPVQDSFRRFWPEAGCINILDDGLSPDRERDGHLTDAMCHRIGDLADYAVSAGAGGILFTCSAFGPAIAQAAAQLAVPVLKPNEAMFEAALEAGSRIGMLATFEPSVASMEQEFRDMAEQSGRAASIETICVPAAMAALKSGDAATHNRLLAQAAPRLEGCDAVLLAHFSTARAESTVQAALGRPVQTSPG